jgi:cell wall-associated NlpC family hydrolase
MNWAIPYIGRTDVNCWGLIREIYGSQLGIQLPSYGEVDARELQAVAEAVDTGRTHNGTWVKITPFPSVERSFDVVVMRGWLPCSDGRIRRGVVHTGVVTRPSYVMHTDMGYAVVEVPLNHPTVRGKLVGCYRHVALAVGGAA